jgi:hypothetical protein
MSNPDIDRHFGDLFDAHDAAILALREASAAMGKANQAMIETQVAWGVAIKAHDDAAVSALTANRAALAILRAYKDDDTP